LPTRKPRVGLLVLFVPFYEKIVELRREKEIFAMAISRRLAEEVEVVWPGMIDCVEAARVARNLFLREEVDAVVIAPSLAVFGALGWSALESLDVPVAIWSIQPAVRVPDRYDIGELIRNSGNLGTEALANTLARAGQFFRTAFSTVDAPVPARLIAFLRAAAVAAAVRRAVFGRIGSGFAQMTDVQMDTEAWTRATGSRVVDISAAEFTESYLARTAWEVQMRAGEMKAAHPIEAISEDELLRSARLSLALDEVVARHGLDGGAFNCHGENCLQNPAIGVTACYGVSKQTTEGRPFSCTGDLPTAVALYIMKRLTGSAIYAELDFVDRVADFVILTNGGEADFCVAAGPVHLAGNENFEGIHGRGASPRMNAAAGGATLLSFTPLDRAGRYRMIAGVGNTLLDHPIPDLGVFHQAFRFEGVEAVRAFELWCDAGAVHHLALAPGDWIAELRLIAEMLHFEFVQIGGCVEAER
jgi:L-arabinose isomerase